MKKISLSILVLVMGFGLAACGGGGGGGTPVTAQGQAATEAAIEATISAGGEAVLQAIQPAASAQAIKASQTYVIDTTPVPCNEGDPTAGTYTATGTVTADCTFIGESGTCTITDGPAMILFTDCKKSVTSEGTTYNEVLNGTATTNITGTVSGGATGVTAIDATGNLGGTVTLTGDAPGTVDLAGVTWTATGTPDPEPTIGCNGTASVTITGQAAQSCSVASDCKGCSN